MPMQIDKKNNSSWSLRVACTNCNIQSNLINKLKGPARKCVKNPWHVGRTVQCMWPATAKFTRSVRRNDANT